MIFLQIHTFFLHLELMKQSRIKCQTLRSLVFVSMFMYDFALFTLADRVEKLTPCEPAETLLHVTSCVSFALAMPLIMVDYFIHKGWTIGALSVFMLEFEKVWREIKDNPALRCDKLVGEDGIPLGLIFFVFQVGLFITIKSHQKPSAVCSAFRSSNGKNMKRTPSHLAPLL